MRRGELLGLAWDDVALDRRLLHVRRALSVVDGTVRLKATKTNRSRSLSVDDHALAALERRRRAQAHEAGVAGWDNQWDLVFTDETGAPLDPARVTHAFARVARAAPVPRIRLHDLRHLHATQMLAAGVPVPVVSQRLGHAKVTMTLNTYAHVLPAMDADAVALFARRMYGP
jgi:integrase